MFSKFCLFLFAVFLLGCSTTKTLKEIPGEGPQGSDHVFKMSKYVIEVKDSSTRRLKFYFYDMEMRPININMVEVKKGTLDPDNTKANFGIDFIRHTDYIEGIVHTKYSQKHNYDIDLDVKIDGERRKITIPMRNN
ncbi:hypothetical protein ACJVC5_11775 [Peredibacter sp. HCB2-198]|uniref:hypothetical protein n=1 Tax=Peredibacter sp. HCB2-198 TaxID=3383025 RepID=UPI0038B62DA9